MWKDREASDGNSKKKNFVVISANFSVGSAANFKATEVAKTFVGRSNYFEGKNLKASGRN